MAVSRPAGAAGIVTSVVVQQALRDGAPIVALESALITHGLPFPENIEVATQMESVVAAEGATPATTAVIHGTIHVGLTAEQIRALAESKASRKIGVRDFASAALQGTDGGTTVAATLFAAFNAGIRIFATGGIGGVHRENPFDISADLVALSHTPMLVICAGAKAFLDLPATLEYLETMSVPVVGYGTGDFPAFYSRTSGLEVSVRLDTARAVVEYWRVHRALGMNSALLVANPIPEGSAIPREEMESFIVQASQEAQQKGIHGQALTPFLLGRLGQLSNLRSTRANLDLLINNARLAAQIAIALADE